MTWQDKPVTEKQLRAIKCIRKELGLKEKLKENGKILKNRGTAAAYISWGIKAAADKMMKKEILYKIFIGGNVPDDISIRQIMYGDIK